MSVTASAFIASTMLGAETADAASYKVKPGDSLWAISQKYNTSVAQLKSWNNLTNTIIFPNQVLQIDGKENVSKPPAKNDNKGNSSNSASTYTVKSGDSLSKIAAAHGISLTNLMKWNNLTSTLIFPGDKFIVSKDGAGGSSGNSGNSGSSNSNSGSGSGSSNAGSGGSTYTVKSGDTLGHIAAAHGISLKNLMDWNGLTSHLIYPGNKLVVSKGASNNNGSSNSGSSGNANSGSGSSNSGSSGSTYTVKSGDSLSKIAVSHSTTVANLMKWNNLSSHLIYPGEKLVVSKSGSSGNNGQAPPKQGSKSLIDTAKSVIGAPYLWAGNTPNGFDCSGFIYWALNNSGTSMP